MIPLVAFQAVPIWSLEVRLGITAIWALILIVDTVDIMIKMKKDEREKVHEAIAERNAMWVLTAVLAAGVAYQAAASGISQKILVDPWIVAALFLGLAAKAITNYYLDRKD